MASSGSGSQPLKRMRHVHEHGQELVSNTEYHGLLTKETPELQKLIQIKPIRALLLKHGTVDEPAMKLIKGAGAQFLQVEALMRHVQQGDMNRFTGLLKSLAESNQSHVITKLGIDESPYLSAESPPETGEWECELLTDADSNTGLAREPPSTAGEIMVSSDSGSPPLKPLRHVQEPGQTLVSNTEYYGVLTEETPELRKLIQMRPIRALLLKHGTVDEPAMKLIKGAGAEFWQVEALIRHVQQGDINRFTGLLKSLAESNQSHVITKLGIDESPYLPPQSSPETGEWECDEPLTDADSNTGLAREPPSTAGKIMNRHVLIPVILGIVIICASLLYTWGFRDTTSVEQQEPNYIQARRPKDGASVIAQTRDLDSKTLTASITHLGDVLVLVVLALLGVLRLLRWVRDCWKCWCCVGCLLNWNRSGHWGCWQCGVCWGIVWGVVVCVVDIGVCGVGIGSIRLAGSAGGVESVQGVWVVWVVVVLVVWVVLGVLGALKVFRVLNVFWLFVVLVVLVGLVVLGVF